MDLWTYLEYAAWAASALFGLFIVLYYFLMLRFSEIEYREVIAEKFGE